MFWNIIAHHSERYQKTREATSKHNLNTIHDLITQVKHLNTIENYVSQVQTGISNHEPDNDRPDYTYCPQSAYACDRTCNMGNRNTTCKRMLLLVQCLSYCWFCRSRQLVELFVHCLSYVLVFVLRIIGMDWNSMIVFETFQMERRAAPKNPTRLVSKVVPNKCSCMRICGNKTTTRCCRRAWSNTCFASAWENIICILIHTSEHVYRIAWNSSTNVNRNVRCAAHSSLQRPLNQNHSIEKALNASTK